MHLHRLVAHFLRVRFPILLALNKADEPDSAAHITRVAAVSTEPSVAVSARCEWALNHLRRCGAVEYCRGGVEFAELRGLQPADLPEELFQGDVPAFRQTCARMLGSHAGTGVLRALNAAVALSPPLCVYPVESLDTCESLARGDRGDGAVLRDCLLMHPGTRS